MERTITILGTIDNCKKAESLISAKLRASYESDMAQFIPASVSERVCELVSYRTCDRILEKGSLCYQNHF